MDIDIEYVARLARIELNHEQKKKFTHQLGDILAYVDKLKELDTRSIIPMSHVLPLQNVFRQNNLISSLPVEKVLNNAPAKGEDNFFSVPRIIE